MTKQKEIVSHTVIIILLLDKKTQDNQYYSMCMVFCMVEFFLLSFLSYLRILFLCTELWVHLILKYWLGWCLFCFIRSLISWSDSFYWLFIACCCYRNRFNFDNAAFSSRRFCMPQIKAKTNLEALKVSVFWHEQIDLHAIKLLNTECIAELSFIYRKIIYIKI